MTERRRSRGSSIGRALICNQDDAGSSPVPGSSKKKIVLSPEEKEKRRKQANRNRRRGRSQQNRVAKLTGGANVGHLSGEDISHCSRVFDSTISIETKHLNKFSGATIMVQAVKNSKKKTPVCWIHLNKTRVSGDIIMVRLCDLEAFKNAIVGGLDEK